MSSVTLFKQFLKEKPTDPHQKSRDPATLYLNHYFASPLFVKNGLNPPHQSEQLKPHHFTKMYKKALLFPYWQKNITSLKNTVVRALTHFSKTYGPLDFNPLTFCPVDQWQWVYIQHAKDRLNMVHLYLQQQSHYGEQVRILPFRGENTLALILKPTGQLKVFSFSPLALISKGTLKPLAPLSELHYNAQYELALNQTQVLEQGHLNFIYFKTQHNKAYGTYHKGFCLQPVKRFQQVKFKDLSLLFEPLKQMECLFISATSDPYYKDLMHALNTCYQRFLCESSISQKEVHQTRQVLFQARHALKALYPKNPLLLLMIANMEFHLRKLTLKTHPLHEVPQQDNPQQNASQQDNPHLNAHSREITLGPLP